MLGRTDAGVEGFGNSHMTLDAASVSWAAWVPPVRSEEVALIAYIPRAPLPSPPTTMVAQLDDPLPDGLPALSRSTSPENGVESTRNRWTKNSLSARLRRPEEANPVW